VRPRHINFLANAASSASLIFIPLWAAQLGASVEQIGFIFAAYNGSILVSSYLFGRAADLHGSRKILQAGLVLASVASFLQVFAFEPATVTVTRVFLGFSVGMYPAALLAYARTSDRAIGPFAAWGSLGWGLGSFLAGFADVFAPSDARPIFILSSLLFLATFGLALSARPEAAGTFSIPLFPVALIKRNLPVYVAMLIRHTGANMIWVIFPLFMRDRLGMTGLEIGIAYALNPVVQFVVMRQLDRFRSTTLVAIGLIGSALTFLSFTVAQNFPQMLLTQVLLGFSWATLYVGSLQFIVDRNPETATAGGILGSVLSISSILGPIIGGVLSAGGNYLLPMYVAAGMCIAAFAAYWFELRTSPTPARAPATRSGD